MKSPLIATLGLAVTFASSAFAGSVATASKEPVIAPPTATTSGAGPFVGVEGGAFWLKNLSVTTPPFAVDMKFKPGYGITVPFGYNFGNGFSASFSAGYDHVDFDGMLARCLCGKQRQFSSARGSFAFIPLMANVSYSFKIAGNLSFYIGAGAGAVHESSSFDGYTDSSTETVHYSKLGETGVFDGLSDREWNFGWQGFAGLSYELNPTTFITLGYRYMGMDDHVSVNGNSSGRLQGQTAELGMLVKF